MNKTYKTNKTDWRRLVRSILFVALLLGASLPARAQTQYVFMYNNYFVAQSTTPTTSFVPNASVYSGTSGSTFRNGNNYYIYYNNGLKFSTTNSGNLYIYNNYLVYPQYPYYGEQYIQYNYALNMQNPNNNNRAWRMTDNNNQATVYAVTTEVIKMLSDFTISGDDVLTSATTYPYTHTNSYLTNYTKYSWTDHTYYSTNPAQAASTTVPAATEVTTGYTWSLDGGGTNASVNASSGQITVSSLPTTDLVMTLTCSVTNNGVTKTASKTVVLQGTTIAAPSITRTNNDIILATTSVGATIYYTTNGSTPSASNGSAYTIPFSLEELTLPVTINAIAIRDGVSSTVANATYSTLICVKPEISIASNGAVTITSATSGASIRYTTDGTDPSASSGTVYSGSFNVNNLTTVKAIAYKDGYDNSSIASEQYLTTGVSGDYVILNDRENHSWAYYSDPDCPVRSLNPADVKITYYGDGIMMTGTTDYTSGANTGWIREDDNNYVGNAKVNVGGEDENTFIYFKTLERTDGSTSANPTGRCPYTTIPNPFQVRPTYGSTWDGTNTDSWAGWRGFQCWRLKSFTGGSVYSASSGGTALAVGAIINAETEIYFAPNSEYGMAVELEAVWAIAYVVKANGGGANAIQTKSVGYERNFIVLHSTDASFNFGGTSGKRITNINYPATVSTYYPDGTQGTNSGSTLRGAADAYNLTLQANTKFENIQFNMSGKNLTADGHSLIIGRGCSGTVNYIRGLDHGTAQTYKVYSSNLNYTIRIESGTLNYLSFYAGQQSTNGTVDAYTRLDGTSNYVKSILGSDYDRAQNNNNNLDVKYSVFMGSRLRVDNQNASAKTLDVTIKSGKYHSSLGDNMGTADATVSMYLSIANYATTNTKAGGRSITIEGGEMANIAGGVDVNQDGDNHVRSLTFRMKGGTVKGAIYGGGAVSPAWGDRWMVFTGGTVKGWIGAGCNGVTGTGATSGGQTNGESFVYVGGNTHVGGSAAINGSDGGTVFGAGKGSGAADETQSGMMSYGTNLAIADNADILNNVYGGGNFGFANEYTNLHILGGTVHGDIFGGSNQNKGPNIDITMKAGTINGGLYGGCNTSGDISGHINIDIYGTDPAPSANAYAIHQVFGGGNQADYSGTPVVTVHDDSSCNISIGEVYGGGNRASVTGTNVTIEAGNRIGYVYGGGYGANVTTNGTKVNIKGGTIEHVFGGNNYTGTITGGLKVRVNKDSECPLKIGELYGGGNHAASAAGSIDIGCTGTYVDGDGGHADCNETTNRIGYELEGIGDVFGGANEANISTGITLTIDSGMVYRVFGGNNSDGDISGTITVNIQKTNPNNCGWYVGYVYGGGFNADYSNAATNNPAVNVSAGKVTYNVYGGGKGTGAVVTGNPTVTLSGTAEVGGNVFGGGDAAAVDGNTSVKLQN